MAWKGQAELTSKELKPWKSGGEVVGTMKEVNIRMVEGDEKKTRFALVTIDGSGHMVCWTKLRWVWLTLFRFHKISRL